MNNRATNNSLASVLSIPLVLMFGSSGCFYEDAGSDDSVSCEECLDSETGENKIYGCACDLDEDSSFCNPPLNLEED
jgi:hypothetical protein